MTLFKTAVVLGAGFQGVCAALALAQNGYQVRLVDRDPDLMLRASLRNEGKIHLGFVYANDPAGKTAPRMLESAMRFADLTERWLDRAVNWDSLRSRPFLYAAPRDSQRTPAELVESYDVLQNLYEREFAGRGPTYLGLRPERLWETPTSPATDATTPWESSGFATTVARTVEAALDLAAFREIVRDALSENERVECLFGRTIECVERTAFGFRVSGRDGDGWSLDADIVVNCLWDGRLAIDQTLGIRPDRPWVYRLKYRLLGRIPDAMPDLSSATFVLGAYGDIVTRQGGGLYLSWYPSCLRGWSGEIKIPAEWDDVCRGMADPKIAESVRCGALDMFERIAPGLGDAKIDTIDAGVIFSWGESDIDDTKSVLHQRYAIGVTNHDGYVSIDTGKFTCAPLFASHLLDSLGISA